MSLLIPIALGLLVAIFPIELFAVLLGAVALPLTMLFPEYVTLLMVVLLSSIVFEDDLPLLPLPGIGSLHITDILFLVLLLKVLYLVLFDKKYKFMITPLITPLMLFFSMVIFATVNAIHAAGTDLNTVVRETRGFCYYLVFIVVVGLFRKEKQLEVLNRGLLLIGTLVALAMIAQAVVGPVLQLMPGRVEEAGTFGSGYSALRILPPGQMLVYILFISMLCRVVLASRRILHETALAVVLAAGVMLTYNRVYWVSSILAVAALFLLSRKEEMKRVVIVVSLFGGVIFTTLTAFTFMGGKYAESAAAMCERFVSVFAGSQLTSSDSIEDRITETHFALETISRSPLVGSGLHTIYRPSMYGSKDTLTAYIHNAYLWFLKDMGIVGLAFFMWFFVGFVLRGLGNLNSIKDPSHRAILAGFTLSALGIIPMSVVSPVYMQWYSILCIAVTSGICELIIYLNRSSGDAATAPES